MTVMIVEDPALPDAEIDEHEAVIACLGDDAALLRRDNPDCEIAANMDAAADMLEKLRELVGLAYGYLWLVNNEPGTPHQYKPERAAYEARKLLRDTMTHEQRAKFINRVVAQVRDLGA